MPPERLADAVKGARAMGWVGFNCSIPHKVAVIEHLDGLGESARLIGADVPWFVVAIATSAKTPMERVSCRHCARSWIPPGSILIFGAGVPLAR